MSSTNRKRYIVDFHEGLHHFIHSGDLVIHNERKHDSYVGFGNCLYNIKTRLTAWRENDIKVPFTVTYKMYKVTNHPSKGRYFCARWVDKKETIYSLPFKYVQLKYDADKEIITTSKGAKVRLNDAILLWKLYKRTLENNKINIQPPTTDFITIHLANKNIKCGIYNVIGIYHNLKRDDGDNCPRYAWNVVIGCHTIWIDDFINFVEYYKLQKYFPN